MTAAAGVLAAGCVGIVGVAGASPHEGTTDNTVAAAAAAAASTPHAAERPEAARTATRQAPAPGGTTKPPTRPRPTATPPNPPAATTKPPQPPQPSSTAKPPKPPKTDGKHTGRATFHSTGMGSCGQVNNDRDLVVALSSELMPGYPSPNCGKKIRVSYKGKSVDVTVTDTSPGSGRYDLDLSPAAFDRLGDRSQGTLYGVTWKFL
ncbi:RlpA-like double-psi beta-barrel domain-containing protein [Streptomyces globosus]|uniref:RlpA-like double-psi beta-barrel domain-containing protein n=1 Tax=Streptomyces globosus TaxID=68209 RepID=UPI0031D82F72